MKLHQTPRRKNTRSAAKFWWLLVLPFFVVLSAAPLRAAAQATLFVSPSAGTYKVGERFSVLVNVNTGGEAINAASGQLNFDNSRLEVVSLGYSSSIFNLWTTQPSYSNAGGTVQFSGGLPSPGFTGASGAIVRVTFRPKANGQAPLTFVSGSVLANDGAGTNIADSLKGALFTVIAVPVTPVSESKPVQKIESPTQADVVEAQAPIEAPSITEWPKQLASGETLVVKGLGLPLSKIIIAVQKGEGEPVRAEIFSGHDGHFSFTHREPVKAGFYRVWARNVSLEGVASPPSEMASLEVVEPTFFRIGSVAINYASMAVTLLALIVLLVLLLAFLWWKVRGWQKKQGKEIGEAEAVVHGAFDTLKDGLTKYISYLAEAKNPASLKRREAKTREEVRGELEEMEEKIEKEIKDIKKAG
ncbi:MAG: cohesin domain-containing protein [bacterium]|nr:cohesin domain-containing protein [bacterium]